MYGVCTLLQIDNTKKSKDFQFFPRIKDINILLIISGVDIKKKLCETPVNMCKQLNIYE